MALTASVTLSLSAKLTSALDLGTAQAPVTLLHDVDWSDGASAGQANRIFADTRQLAASATEDLDLAGVLLDPLGATLTFARIKTLFIRAAAGNTNTLTVARPASNGLASLFAAASDQIILRPGASMLFCAGEEDSTGWAVVAGTGDLITIGNGGAGTVVNYDVVIIGAAT